jgi:hypothetical protein
VTFIQCLAKPSYFSGNPSQSALEKLPHEACSQANLSLLTSSFTKVRSKITTNAKRNKSCIVKSLLTAKTNLSAVKSMECRKPRLKLVHSHRRALLKRKKRNLKRQSYVCRLHRIYHAYGMSFKFQVGWISNVCFPPSWLR